MQPGPRRRIMVIDDSLVVRRIIEAILVKDGYIVNSFGDGVEAINSLLRGLVPRPDLVLLDIILPTMDGYSVARLFKQHKDLHDTQIVMISSRDSVFDKVRGQMVGARRYITKPFEPSEILDAVNTLLREKEKEKE
jgi:twitching motility two-component system response regulator PilG